MQLSLSEGGKNLGTCLLVYLPRLAPGDKDKDKG